MKQLTRKQRGLGKYDAPLKFQYEKGYTDFKHGRVFNPFHKDTMQHREWLRGFNKAYFEQLKRVKGNELKARSRSISEGEVRHV
jgi:hypothetical protein|tara:strand:+ start:255 stop:506 length:252 start_codon:yes stop_codon:yes gene_type:complete